MVNRQSLLSHGEAGPGDGGLPARRLRILICAVAGASTGDRPDARLPAAVLGLGYCARPAAFSVS
jgi:hypothetical protein